MINIKIETNYVRVIGNTRSPSNEEINEMIGQELEVRESYYEEDKICVWNKDKSDYDYFNKSDVRFLTPAMFKGKHIAIDDEVLGGGDWRKVFGFFICDNEIRVLAGTPENTIYFSESSIKDHRTNTETKMTIAQIEEKLNITGLKIIE